MPGNCYVVWLHHREFDPLLVFHQVPIIPVVFSSYSNFYLQKEKQFKSGNYSLSFNWVFTVGKLCIHVCLFISLFGSTCRDHQIEDPSKDRDKRDDARWRVIPLWQVFQSDALCLPGHLRNSEQRAAEALNIYHTPASAFPLPDLPVLLQEQYDTSWVLTTEDSQSRPSSGTSANAALHAVSGVTDGEMNSVDALLFTIALPFDANLVFVPFLLPYFCLFPFILLVFIFILHVFLCSLQSTPASSGVMDCVEVKYYCSGENPQF